jgi:hypothetical protein
MTKRGRLARKLFRHRRRIDFAKPGETIADCHQITRTWKPKIYTMDFVGTQIWRFRRAHRDGFLPAMIKGSERKKWEKFKRDRGIRV